jgi:uncharacterized protein
MITPQIAKLLAEQLPDILADGEAVDVLWHGGEPTLLPVGLFEEMQLSLLARLESSGHSVRTMIQTNGVNLSSEWRDCLCRFCVSPGVSLDGPAFLHDAVRPTKGGSPSYESVVQNIRSMTDRGLAVSLLCVVGQEHTQNVPAIACWAEELRLPIRFNPLLACGRSREALSRQAYFQFLRDICVLFSELPVDIQMEPLAGMFKCLLWERAATECSYSGACGRSILTVFPNGEIGPCGRSAVRYGNIMESPLSEIWLSGERFNLMGRGKRLDGFCGNCPVRAGCNGGCPAVNGDTPDKDYCSEYGAFFAWLAAEGTLLFQKSLLREKSKVKNRLNVLKTAREELARGDHV